MSCLYIVSSGHPLANLQVGVDGSARGVGAGGEQADGGVRAVGQDDGHAVIPAQAETAEIEAACSRVTYSTLCQVSELGG